MGVRTDHGGQQRDELVQYMRDFIATNHYTPTIAEMARGMGMHRTAVTWHLTVLRDEGRVHYVDGHLAHSLQLTGKLMSARPR